MRDGGSTVPRRQLGRELRRLREEAGIQVSAAAQALEWSGPKLWRIEKGLTAIRSLDVAQMCRLYDADEQTTEALTSLAKASKDRGWWHAYGDTIPAWFELYVGLEQAATGLRAYEPELIPGLLQTADYARAVVQAGEPKLPAEEVDERVRVRMTRQQLLNRTVPPPPRLDVIIGEQALLKLPTSAEFASEQLLHLIKMAGKPGISVSVLPLDRGLTPVVNTGAFTILDFPINGRGPNEPTTVYCQGLTGALYLDREEEITVFEDVWASAADDALTDEDAVNFLREKVESLT